jgi:hypothetical protein
MVLPVNFNSNLLFRKVTPDFNALICAAEVEVPK